MLGEGGMKTGAEEQDDRAAAQMGAANVIEEFEALERSAEELESARAAFAAELTALRMASTTRVLSNPGTRETPAERKKRTDLEADLEAHDRAIEITKRRLEALAPGAQAARSALAGAAANAAQSAEERRAAAALPAIGEHLDAVLAKVRAVTSSLVHQSSLFTELGRVFRKAVEEANRGHAASVSPALEELARDFVRRADWRDQGPGTLPPVQVPDTPVVALAGFTYRLSNAQIVSRTVPAGSVATIERAAAERAAARGLCEIISLPAGEIRVTLTRIVPVDDERQLPEGWRGTLPIAIARGLIQSGAAIVRYDLTREEIERSRPPNSRLSQSRLIDLGLITGEPLGLEAPIADTEMEAA
jgi:ribosomal protein L29